MKKLFVVRKTKSEGFVLSDQKPVSVLGKQFFPGDKYQLASLTQDARGDGNVITDADAITYLQSLKRGDVVEWCEPTDQPVEFTGKEGNTITLKRKWVMPQEDALLVAVDAYIDSITEDAAPAPKKKATTK
jgi:hypothetical protein